MKKLLIVSLAVFGTTPYFVEASAAARAFLLAGRCSALAARALPHTVRSLGTAAKMVFDAEIPDTSPLKALTPIPTREELYVLTKRGTPSREAFVRKVAARMEDSLNETQRTIRFKHLIDLISRALCAEITLLPRDIKDGTVFVYENGKDRWVLHIWYNNLFEELFNIYKGRYFLPRDVQKYMEKTIARDQQTLCRPDSGLEREIERVVTALAAASKPQPPLS